MSIENFEEWTEEFNQDLLPIAQWVDDLFSGKSKWQRPTSAKPIKSPVLVRAVKDIFSLKSFNGVKLRSVINYLRQNGSVPIGSNSKGYYVCTTAEEIDSNIRSLQQRANGIMIAADGLRRFT